MLLDIIIPQYKEDEDVIKNLLNSINNQKNADFNQIKITIVNDKSDVLLSDEFLKSFKNLNISYIINDKNTGPGLARQKGVDNTNATYIMFCDSDDELYNDEVLYKILDYISLYEPNYLVSNIAIEMINGNKEIKKGADTFPWMHGKVYKRSFLKENDIRFHPIVRHVEDAYFTSIILGVIDHSRINYLDYTTYVWKANTKSLTRKKNDHHYTVEIFDDFYNSAQYIYEFLNEKKSKYKLNYLLSSIFGNFIVLNSDLFDHPDLKEKKDYYENKLKEFAYKKRNAFVLFGREKVQKIYENEFRQIVIRNGIKYLNKDLDDFYREYLKK